jgi:hypothetical protein
MFNPLPTVLVDVTIRAKREPRDETVLSDFALRDDVLSLLGWFDELKNAWIERIEVRSGTPRRIVYEQPLTGMLQ